MAVHALSSPLDSAPIPLSFQTLGEVIDSVGTPDFVPRLTVLLNQIVPVNAVHIERSRVDAAMPTGFRCEWVGSGGVGMDHGTIAEVMTLYYDRFYDRDPLFAGIRGEVGTLLVVRDIGAIPPGEFHQRLYDEVQIAHECVLARGTRHAQHSIALERDTRQPAFSLAEMQRFRTVSDCLFPLLELHAATAASRRIAHVTPHLHPLAQFDARLARDQPRLSRREYEICAQLIGGRTVPEAAEIVGVRVATAESYVKRAFAKLGVRTKRELLAWAQSGAA
ncbi:LuxR family transcriptional regulator [Burkholderia gladioli pv. alliicola]|uniref:helix-turn-helix transcriptional regulator n=1 Tax=Burkholderia gladioli TaxID=28095 RepID=UPI002ABD026F|nr:LuxR family transcriptional regulator [Burkholderia gladioli]MDZ4035367.1 LuxR family transcriptional regulator [Burkholderia gladioli pv. alliicola]